MARHGDILWIDCRLTRLAVLTTGACVLGHFTSWRQIAPLVWQQACACRMLNVDAWMDRPAQELPVLLVASPTKCRILISAVATIHRLVVSHY